MKCGSDLSFIGEWRSLSRLVCFACIILSGTICPGSTLQAQSYSDSALVVGNGSSGPYLLTGCPLLSDSLDITGANGIDVDRTLLPYTVYRKPARITFSSAVPVGDTLVVLFAALPFSVRSVYSDSPGHSPAIIPAATVGPVRQTRRETNSPPAPFQLEIDGAKTFGITVGNNGDAKTEQGLQLSIDGKLTETVSLTAAVSDRFSDRLTSGASASRLNDLDDFFVAVKSPTFETRLGELLIDSPVAGMSGSRRLSGGEARWSPGGQRFHVGGGKLEGIARRVDFFPQYGRQGPYAVSAARRPVVPGSETVYLNGRRLEQGPKYDYTIDYFLGELTFTPRTILSERDRITVGFEESAHAYQRRGVFVGWQGLAAAGRIANELGLSWEGDDSRQGIGFGLSGAERDSLGRTSEGILVKDGVEYVGPDAGEYISVDSAGSSIYHYVGPKNGEYNVRFEYAGAGEGAYVHLGGGAFGFVGPGNGDFQPRITVQAPTARMVLTDQLQVSNTPIGSVDLALAGQVLQPNRLNSQFRQTDWVHDLAWSSSPMKNGEGGDETLEMGARWRRLNDRIAVDYRLSSAEIAREWFLPNGSGQDDLDVLESTAQLNFNRRLRVKGELGRMIGTYTGTRNAQSVEFNASQDLLTELIHRRSVADPGIPDARRKQEIWQLGQSWRGGWLGLAARAQREDRYSAGSLGDRFDGYEFELGVAEWRLVYAADRVYDIAEVTSLAEKRRSLKLTGSASRLPLGISGSVSAVRTSRRRVADNRLTRDYFGGADVSWSWPRAGLSASLNYQLNKIGTRNQSESYIPVADGYGEYRREDSLFIPDPAGDYIRVAGSSGKLQSAADGRKELVIRRSYTTAGRSGTSFWDNFSADVRLLREERIDPEQISISNWLMPWGSLRPSGSAIEYTHRRLEFSTSLERRFPSPAGTRFLRGQYRRRNGRFGALGSPSENKRQTWELTARGYRPQSVWNTWEVSLSRQERTSAGYAGVTDVDVRSHRAQAVGGFRSSGRTQATITTAVEHLRNRADLSNTVVYGLTPSMTVYLGPRTGRGSIKSSVKYYYVDAEVPLALVPGISGGYSPGHNTRFSLDGRVEVSGSIALTVRSTIDWYEQRRPLYRLNMQAVTKF